MSDFLIPDQSLDSSLADVMTVRQQQCGYLYMIGATYDQIGELLGFSRSNAVEHVAHVREGLEGFGMLKASRLVGWLFFFAHNYIRQEVHPESPLLRLNFKDIRGLLGMNKEQFCNW
ncbi:hypothetical protein [Endozoicomonas sp. Mp262]|uniref:hypothetical protein n=1 Tax=Endozoicomonas sp. Mp262 TaxID=2919499 RepID=UPI0021DA6F14